MQKVTAVILAAGSAKRMKTVKQLLPFKDTILLGRVITQAQASPVDEVITVLGANYNKIKEEITPYITKIVRNENWEQGLGSSIATGVRSVQESGEEPDGLLILLGDQPLIDAGYLGKLLETFRQDGKKIVATQYPHSIGVPAIFPSEYFEELTSLEGDSGAKYLLSRDAELVTAVDPADKTLDIDTPEDYRHLRNKYE